ncbi:hybrid sensor histidine kinase/response regulator transcription factor [Mucilaginibacter auburnensis]|uniref:histidine kinase n=1 Tax=Mucilaginibacter auburnensis TaxID=1457233 RepID=A0A2H9VNU9_9SPHI|nr:two-component regulator propeller domain-containing protein [Mucilaginibacter auburnensis]PJJ80028.1 signal transduction histidine kinase [Mucilaginibacter auburnensis]
MTKSVFPTYGFIRLLTALLILFSSAAYGQGGYDFTHITTSEGLSSNAINAITKDTSGFVWFGTMNGLNRFDGTNIVIYRNIPKDSLSLPSNVIQALYKDKFGRLWVGTSNGLCYYDPLKDVFIPIKETYGLSVRVLCRDYKGNLWIGSYSDLRIIENGTNKIILFETPAEARRTEKVWRVISLFEDNQRRMWIGSRNGLYRFDPRRNKVDHYIHDQFNPKSLSNNNVTRIVQDNSNRMWFSTSDGLNTLLQDGAFRVFKDSDRDHIGANIIHDLAIAPGLSELWLTTEEGLRIFDLNSMRFNVITSNPRNVYGLRNNQLKTLYIADDKIFWIGLIRGGINKYDKNLALFGFQPSVTFQPKYLPSPIVTSLATLKNNSDVFVGTIGAGLQVFNKNTRTTNLVPLSASSLQPNVLAIKILKSGQLWIATREGDIFQYDPKKRKSELLYKEVDGKLKNENAIRCLDEDNTGKVWIGINGQGVKVFDPSKRQWEVYPSVDLKVNGPSLPTNGYIRAIATKKNGEVWIGSYGSGMAVFNPKTQKFALYSKAKGQLINNYILCILHDRNQRTWVGTNSGLCVFDEKRKSFRGLTEAGGFFNHTTIYQIVEDKAGLIWMSTNKGLSSFNPLNNTVKSFTTNNGVANAPFYEGSGIAAENGTVYFGGESGFNFFESSKVPSIIQKHNVLLTKLKVSNNVVVPGKNSPIKEQINFAKEIILKYGENFSIEYAALDFTNPNDNQFEYRLDGLDHSWNRVGSVKSASYTNLDPGKYIFHVKASYDGRNWSSQEKNIQIIVLPPWWRTIYAYCAYGLIIFSILYFHRKRTIDKIKREFDLQQERSRAKDLIDRQRLEAERMHAIDSLKIKFLTNLSHDFSTPLSLITGPVEKLIHCQDKTVVAESVVIQRNAKRLLNLVNQLLDFRKMEVQQLNLNLAPGDLVKCLKEASEAFNDIAERKNIYFNFSSEIDELPCLFDHDKIERIVFNLLSNAFKFTLIQGEVAVHFYVIENNGDGKNTMCLEINDTGIGIPENLQEKIFEPFFQHSTKGLTTGQGSGIGLSIVSEFVRMHGGTLSLNSQVDEGSSFKITMPIIPLAVAQTAVDDQERTYLEFTPEDLPTSQKRVDIPVILIVDDDEDIRFYLKDNLKGHYNIVEASNGREGWKKVLSQHPQLVVSDVSMPEMSGIELSKKIKADKRTCHIPVILLTGISGEKQQVEGLEAGANDYLTKPFNFEILHVKIRNLLFVNQTLKNTFLKKVQIIEPKEEIESANIKLLKKINHYIKENMSNTNLSVEDISAYVGMSRGTLYRKLMELTELSPVEYIRSIKLENAAELLAQSNLNVSQIAYMTGFANPNYFAKVFKAKYQMSPKEFIAQAKKNIS